MTSKSKRLGAMGAGFLMMLVGAVLVPRQAWAECADGQVETAILGNDGCWDGEMIELIQIVLDVMLAGVGVVGLIGIVWVGVTYLTAGGDVAKTQRAKSRLVQIVIGMAVYVMLYLIVTFLMPV